jgi:hypothetical protein
MSAIRISPRKTSQREIIVTYLTDILVSHLADLLDIGGTLRDVLERVTLQNKLVLLGGGDLDLDTGAHDDSADQLLANEVTDLNLVLVGLGVLVDVDVDGEMGVDVAHLVLEALGDTDDQVVDQSADGTESGNVLAGTVVDLNTNDVLLGVREADGQVGQVLGQLAYREC